MASENFGTFFEEVRLGQGTRPNQGGPSQRQGVVTSTQRVGVVKSVTTGQGRRHRSQQIVSSIGLTRRISQVNVAVHQLAQTQVVDQGDGLKQPRIGCQVVPVKGNVDAGELIRW